MNDTPSPMPPDVPPAPAAAEIPPRNGCLTAIMVLVGIVLLLPGLCAAIFGGMALSEGHVPTDIGSLIMLGLLVGFGGIMLLRAAIRGARR